jgi:hypothetical protein
MRRHSVHHKQEKSDYSMRGAHRGCSEPAGGWHGKFLNARKLEADDPPEEDDDD